MSTPSISVILSQPDGRPVAKVHFNIIKQTTTIKGPVVSPRTNYDDFLRMIEATIRSTHQRVIPLPGQAGGTARFTPKDVTIRNDEANPASNEVFDHVAKVVNNINDEWAADREALA